MEEKFIIQKAFGGIRVNNGWFQITVKYFKYNGQ